MNRQLSGFTLAELAATTVVVGLLFLVILQALWICREESRRANCKDNLAAIGCAFFAYVQGNSEFLPFRWGPTNGDGRSPTPTADFRDVSAPDAHSGNRAYDPSASLGELYPQYVSSAKAFRCPSTNDRPIYTTSVNPGLRTRTLYDRPWTLGYSAPTWPSYGYDPRVHPAAVSNHAVMADMDGSCAAGMDSGSQNHDGGQNVLYVDGHVTWTTTNYASNDANDNIFAEAYKPANPTQGWHADTDSFMVRGSIALTSSYTYAEFNNLW